MNFENYIRVISKIIKEDGGNFIAGADLEITLDSDMEVNDEGMQKVKLKVAL